MRNDRRRFTHAAGGLLASTWIAAAHAKPHEGKGKSGKGGDAEADALVTVTVTVEQARRYAEGCRCTGYASLPPGIRKNLARGKPLPPGIAKKAAPRAMTAQLPHYAGYEWQVAGADLVLVAVAGAVVAAVLADVFR